MRGAVTKGNGKFSGAFPKGLGMGGYCDVRGGRASFFGEGVAAAMLHCRWGGNPQFGRIRSVAGSAADPW